MDNQNYLPNTNRINVNGYYYNRNDTLTLLTDSLSSKSFDGIIPRITRQVSLYNKYTGQFNIKVGQQIGVKEYDEFYRYYPILRIYTDENLKYSGKVNPEYTGIEGDTYFPEFTSDVFIEYLRSDGQILTHVIKTTLTDGFPDNVVQVSYEDWDAKSLGSSGWAITSEGNSIFNNIAVRGSIDALDGRFSGALSVNQGEMKIGAGVSSDTKYSVTKYSSLNNIVTLTLSTTHPFQIGDKITVNTIPSIDLSYINLNGKYTISAIGTYTVSYDYEKIIYPVYDSSGTIIRAADIPETAVTSGYIVSSSLNDGIFINDYNHWYDTGHFTVGNETQSLNFDADTGNLSLTGAINATGGSFTGYVQAGLTKFGANVSDTNDGLYINDINYWYDNTSFRTGTYSAFMNWDAERQTLGARGTLKTKTGELGGLNYGWLVGAGKVVGGGGPSYMALQSGYYSTIVQSIITSGSGSHVSGYSYGQAASGVSGVPNGYILTKIELSIYLNASIGDKIVFRNTDVTPVTGLNNILEDGDNPFIIQYIFNGDDTNLPYIEAFIPAITDWHRSVGTSSDDYNVNTKAALIILVEEELNFIVNSIKVIYLGLDNGNGIYECEVYINSNDVEGFNSNLNDAYSVKISGTKEFFISGLSGDLAPLNDFNFFSEKNLFENSKFSSAFPGDGFLTYQDFNGNNTINISETFSLTDDIKTISQVEYTSDSLIKITLDNVTGITTDNYLTFSQINFSSSSSSKTAIKLFLNNKKYKVLDVTGSVVTLYTPSTPTGISIGTYSTSAGKASKSIITLPSAIRDHSFWVGNENPQLSGFSLDSYGNVTKINVHNINNSAELQADVLKVRDTTVVENLNAERVNGIKITSSSTTPSGTPSTGDIWIVI